MTSPEFQGLDAAAMPPAVTPRGGPGDPVGYDGVTPEGTGPAPAAYDISAPQDIAGITGAFDAAGALTAGAENDIYPVSPRQHEAQALLESPQGYGAVTITTGFPDYESSDVRPGANMENPIQSQGPPSGPYPGTTQPGVPQFMAGLGGDNASLPGVTPETGSMDDSAGGDYPGTLQPGVPKYGTS